MQKFYNFWPPFKLWVLILLLLGESIGCSLKTLNQYKKEGIILRPQSKFTARVTGIKQIRLNHPTSISEKVLKNQLLSLRYQELSLLGKEKPVYQPEEVKQLAPLIAKGLKRVSHKSVLYHEIDGKHGKVAGDVFVSQNRLHWRFHIIAGIDFFNQRIRAFPTPKGQGAFWRLVPHKGQGYHKPKSASLGFKWENWIVANLNLPKAKNLNKIKKKGSDLSPPIRKKSSSTNSHTLSISPVLRNKLKALKKLHDQNLIQDKEYDIKRKEILDDYF